MPIKFTVYGTPQPQGNKTGFVNKHTGKVVMREGRRKESADTFKDWRRAVAAEAGVRIADGTAVMLTGPVMVTLAFYRAPLASAPKRRRIWPATRPDIDKLERAVLDAITGVLIRDDGQVVALAATKDYGVPRVEVWVEAVPDDATAIVPLFDMARVAEAS